MTMIVVVCEDVCHVALESFASRRDVLQGQYFVDHILDPSRVFLEVARKPTAQPHFWRPPPPPCILTHTHVSLSMYDMLRMRPHFGTIQKEPRVL